MYTPWQWRIAFPVVALVTAALAVLLAYGWRAGNPILGGASAGVIAGLAYSIAWTLRRFVPRIAFALFVFGCGLVGILSYEQFSAVLVALALAALISATWIVGYDVLFTRRFHRESVTALRHMGHGEGKRALIVYHSAHRGFQRGLQLELAAALVARGWRVDMTTASHESPTDIEAYDLIVLGSPSYNWMPARPITAYVKRLRDLRGKNVVLIVSGGGMTERAASELRSQIEAAHGRVVEALELWTARTNLPRFGTTEPHEIMRGLAEDLTRRFG